MNVTCPSWIFLAAKPIQSLKGTGGMKWDVGAEPEGGGVKRGSISEMHDEKHAAKYGFVEQSAPS